MKKAISFLLAIVFVLGVPSAALAASESEWNTYWESEEKDAAVYVSPGHSESEKLFTWFGENGGEGKVVLKNGEEEKAFSALGEKTSRGDFVFKVTASGLSVGEYDYVCESEGFTSEKRTISVSDETSFSALYVTDVHMTLSDGEEKLRSHALNFNNAVERARDDFGASLILSGGDQATMGLREEYTAFVSSPALKNMTTALSVGNHDRKGADYKTFAFHPYEGYLGLKSYVGRDYWFVKGDVLFLMIDSNCPDASAHRSFLQSAVLKNRNVKWRVVVMHHDLFGGRIAHRESENRLLRLLYVPLMDEFDVDLVLSGHSHYYTRSNVIKGGFTTEETKGLSSVTNANGTVYLTSGSFTTNSRAAESDEIPPLGDRVGFDWLTSEGIYNILSFSEDSITVRSFTVSGDEPFTEFTLNKTEKSKPLPTPTFPLWNGFVRTLSVFAAFFNNIAMADELKNERGLDIDLRQSLFGCDK